MTRWLSLVLSAALIALAGCDWGGVWTAGVLLVDDDAPYGGDGKSWATAFRHPQDAVDVASAGDEVWIAEGTYVRREGTDTVVVAMKDSVAIYGGFAGTETERDLRDWETYVTSLDGEDVCYHVVVGASDARLDGFTVTRGNAAGVFLDGRGGGMLNDSLTDLTVANCRFMANSAGDGYYMNTAFGGGMRNGGVSDVRITRCLFLGNTAGGGGGVALERDCSVEIVGCRFVGNRATAMAGGGVDSSNSDLVISNSVFSGNAAEQAGGALHYYGNSLSVHSSTFVGNAPLAAYVRYDTGIVLTSCILWSNRKDGGSLELEGSVADVSYSCIRGGWTGEGNIGELPEHDPLFVDPGCWHDNGTPADTSDDYWVDGDYHLTTSSPCLGAGTSVLAPDVDIEDNPRPSGSGYDMGAYQYQQ